MEPIIVESTLEASSEVIWEALTKKEIMKLWYFDIKSFKPETGFEFEFTGTGNDGKKYLHLCKIKDVQENKKLAYSWRYDGIPGESLVTFELLPEREKTKLKLVHEGVETFPRDNPDMARNSFASGWNYIINTSLKKYLEH